MGLIRYGERGIRTLERLSPLQHFQCCAFDHSAISPCAVFYYSSKLRIGAGLG